MTPFPSSFGVYLTASNGPQRIERCLVKSLKITKRFIVMYRGLKCFLINAYCSSTTSTQYIEDHPLTNNHIICRDIKSRNTHIIGDILRRAKNTKNSYLHYTFFLETNSFIQATAVHPHSIISSHSRPE
jgi:hypothetical protein